MCLGPNNAFIYTVQVLQQVNAGRTMHLRQIKRDIYEIIAAKLYKFLYDGFIFKICKAAVYKLTFGFYTGIFTKIVIGAKIIFA